MSILFNKTCLKDKLLPKYTEYKLNDYAANWDDNIQKFRQNQIEDQIKKTKRKIEQLNLEITNIEGELKSCTTEEDFTEILRWLFTIAKDEEHKHKILIQKKLNNLYKGKIYLPNTTDNYINLSNTTLTEHQKEVLNLGPNCHLYSKYSSIEKKAAIETLFQDIKKLEDEKQILTHPELKELLKAEAINNRNTNNKNNSLLTENLKKAAQQLRKHPNITIKKADKTNIFVVLDKDEYHKKLDNIVNNPQKFQKIKLNPTNKLVNNLNKLITANNAEIDSPKLHKLTGDFTPGYLYGTIKIHKPDSPARPIISQIPTPTYQLSKTIKKLIEPYLQSNYSVTSTDELIQILGTQKPHNKLLASLDVENLFTNVPVTETIEIILTNIYKHPELPPLKIKPYILRKLLLACTTQVPFYDHMGKLQIQIDGVSMGSVLGPLFAEFYMAHLENKTFNEIPKPNLYLRYVDDILIFTENIDELKKLQQSFQDNSALKFTYEINKNNKLPFLDVLIDTNHNNITTSPYVKPTSINSCLLNFDSECPFRYKRAVIKNLIKRAKLISSSKIIFQNALKQIKQKLVNNGFPNHIIDEEIKYTLKNINMNENKPPDAKNKQINLYYCNQMHSNFEKDEIAIKQIVRRYINTTDKQTHLKLTIYYKKHKTANLLIMNNSSPPPNLFYRSLMWYINSNVPWENVPPTTTIFT